MLKRFKMIFFLFFLSLLTRLPVARAEERLDFNSAINAVIARSTGISVQEATFGAIQSRNIPTRWVFFPTLTFVGREPVTGTSNFLTVPRQLEISSNWNLFRWGADIQAYNAATSELTSQRYRIDLTVLQTEASAVQALVNEIQRKKEITVNTHIIDNRAQLLKIAQERYQRGYLPIQEVEKLTVDLANAKAVLTNFEILEAEARANLENLLGHSQIIEEWPWIVFFKSTKENAVLNRNLDLNLRPDWISAQYSVQADSQKLSRDWRLLLPSVDAQFSYGRYMGYFGSLTGWTGAISVTLPIFDHFTRYARAKEQSYNLIASQTQMEQVQRNAKAEWMSARASFQKSLSSAIAREHTLILSRKLFEDNLRRYHSGRITANDLAVDQNRMYEAELLAIQGWGAAHVSYTRLCHSLGVRVKDCHT